MRIIREILVGVALGYVAYLFFTVVQTAGAFMDLQMGFGMANVIDPMTGASAPMIGNFKYHDCHIDFSIMNGHHYLLMALLEQLSVDSAYQ